MSTPRLPDMSGWAVRARKYWFYLNPEPPTCCGAYHFDYQSRRWAPNSCMLNLKEVDDTHFRTYLAIQSRAVIWRIQAGAYRSRRS